MSFAAITNWISANPGTTLAIAAGVTGTTAVGAGWLAYRNSKLAKFNEEFEASLQVNRAPMSADVEKILDAIKNQSDRVTKQYEELLDAFTSPKAA